MLLFALIFSAAAYLGVLIGYVIQLIHQRPTALSIIPDVQLGPVPVPALNIGYLIFWISIGAITLRRSLAITREQQRTTAELEAARSVQTFLLGREASAPGYTVESAYLPAQEVGGDFFQTIAGSDGSLLAVIGDVAGKGLRAAMRVSMLIGAVRLSPDESPAALLKKLNGVLLQDGSSGFTTCLAARLDTDGTVTIANAGHLSPYINGRELAIDGGLPLGVVAGAEYSERSFPFVAGDVMLLMSDGVVEAKSASGELFGFERMAWTASSVTGAGALAETAKAFGQDDDITVLRLQRAVGLAV
jgi:serine phosphatase RsbU (regulator of sigma subunit)